MNTRPRLVSKAELARRANVSRSLMSRVSNHGPLSAAMVRGKIDVGHPAVREWLADRGIAPTVLGEWLEHAETPADPGPDEAPPQPMDAHASWDPPNAEELLDLTFREVVDRWGSDDQFASWLDARKRVAEIRRLELQNGQTDGRLITRQLVMETMFSALEMTNRRLLMDAPRTLTRRLFALARSGVAAEEAERIARDIISSQLQHVTSTAARVLRAHPEASAE